MMLMPCPWCGPRNAQEFHQIGEVTSRPDVATATPESWREYLFFRDNPRGWSTEQWYHRAGCRRVLIVERHTETNEVRHARRPSAEPAETGAAPADGDVADQPQEDR